MITIHIWLHNGKKLELPCKLEIDSKEVHTIARQFSAANTVHTIQVGEILYCNGDEYSRVE